MNETLAQKLFYIDKFRTKLLAIANEKTDILFTQNMLVDEEYYTDEIEEILDDIDDALADVKTKLNELVELLKNN